MKRPKRVGMATYTIPPVGIGYHHQHLSKSATSHLVGMAITTRVFNLADCQSGKSGKSGKGDKEEAKEAKEDDQCNKAHTQEFHQSLQMMKNNLHQM